MESSPIQDLAIPIVLTLAISCALPGPAIGNLVTKLFTLFDTPSLQWLYNRTIAAPVLANAGFCWPLGPLIVWFVFRKIAQDVLESSRTEGAGELGQLLRFGLLANLPAIAGCWLLTFAFCFGELSASQTVLPPGMDTVPRLMLGLLHAGVNEMTAALTIVTAACILLISGIGWGLIRFDGRVCFGWNLERVYFQTRNGDAPMTIAAQQKLTKIELGRRSDQNTFLGLRL